MNPNDRTLWMGDLEPYMDANYIGQSFGKMGEEVKSVKIVYDKYSGRMAGYCFVELMDGDSARRAMLNINGKVIPKSRPPVTFNLSFANSPNAPYTEYNLFVNNIPTDLDDAGLFLLFGERYKSCRGAKVYRNSDGSSRGLGFVRFADQTDQQRALVEMNKYNCGGKQMFLKLAQPKFRAPRGAFGLPNYDPINYYPQYSEFYNSAQWQMYDYQGAQGPSAGPYRGRPKGGGRSYRGGAAAGLMDTRYMQDAGGVKKDDPDMANVDPELLPEPYKDPYRSVEEANRDFMEQSEELYLALEESRWCPQLITTSLSEKDL